MDVSALARRINAMQNVKAGSLRFWGEWFGKPYDNQHRVVGCRSEESSLVLDFDGAETLTIDDPEGVQIGPDVFSVADATAVRWEWFYYGRSHTPQNRYFYEFVRTDSGIEASTNVDWCELTLAPSPTASAVEIL
jgi:hypothetical protein